MQSMEKNHREFRFGDYVERTGVDEVSVDTLIALLRKQHNSPVMIICGIGEEELTEVRYYKRDGEMRAVRGPSLVAALILALED